MFLLVVETFLGLFTIARLAGSLRQRPPGAEFTNIAFFLAQVSCLSISSGAYCTHFLVGDVLPRWFYLVGEICGPLDYLFALLFVWNRFIKCRQWKLSQWACVIGLVVVFAGLTFSYAIVPIQTSSVDFDQFSRIINVAVWLVGIAFLAVALPSSLQTLSPADLLVQQSMTLILIAAFATEHQLAVEGYALASWGEVGWFFAFMGLAAAAVLGTRRKFGVFLRPVSMADWFSLRTLIGVSVFAANLTLLTGLLFFGLLDIPHGTHLTVVLTIVYFCWCASQWLALVVSNNVRDIRSLMPAPSFDVEDVGSFRIEAVTQQTQLAEIDDIIAGYNERVAQVGALHAALMEKERQETLGKVAAQVAHDIRSPLAALNVVLPELKNVEEPVRLLLRDGIHRIQDIANDLLQYRRDTLSKAAAGDDKQLLLSAAIEQVVSERRLLCRQRLGLTIDAEQNREGYGLFVRAPSSDFKRILSNLINNAVEAIEDEGMVKVVVRCVEQRATISIIDTGKGMDSDMLAKLGRDMVTSGKKNGNGIGTFQAARDIEAWGGRLTFSSALGAGTTAMIELPVADAPGWFQTGIELAGVEHIVILDDDVSVHRVWKDRFGDAVKLTHCSTAEDFIAQTDNAAGALHLVDYELIGEKTDGLKLIDRLGIKRTSILVTSHFEEQKVLNECLRLGVRVVPKALAATVDVRGIELR